jgi:hypothetical protein
MEPTDRTTPKKYKNNYNTLKRNYILTETMNGFLDKVKKASKGVVDAGAKTMLKVSHLTKLFRMLYHFLVDVSKLSKID